MKSLLKSNMLRSSMCTEKNNDTVLNCGKAKVVESLDAALNLSSHSNNTRRKKRVSTKGKRERKQRPSKKTLEVGDSSHTELTAASTDDELDMDLSFHNASLHRSPYCSLPPPPSQIEITKSSNPEETTPEAATSTLSTSCMKQQIQNTKDSEKIELTTQSDDWDPYCSPRIGLKKTLRRGSKKRSSTTSTNSDDADLQDIPPPPPPPGSDWSPVPPARSPPSPTPCRSETKCRGRKSLRGSRKHHDHHPRTSKLCDEFEVSPFKQMKSSFSKRNNKDSASRSVTFCKDVRARKTLHLNNYTSHEAALTWYNETEHSKMIESCRIIALEVDQVGSTPHCHRGLERLTQKGKAAVWANRRDAYDAVLKFGGTPDDKANWYKIVSRHCLKEARKVGKEDEVVANTVWLADELLETSFIIHNDDEPILDCDTE